MNKLGISMLCLWIFSAFVFNNRCEATIYFKQKIWIEEARQIIEKIKQDEWGKLTIKHQCERVNLSQQQKSKMKKTDDLKISDLSTHEIYQNLLAKQKFEVAEFNQNFNQRVILEFTAELLKKRNNLELKNCVIFNECMKKLKEEKAEYCEIIIYAFHNKNLLKQQLDEIMGYVLYNYKILKYRKSRKEKIQKVKTFMWHASLIMTAPITIPMLRCCIQSFEPNFDHII